jgi:3-deoxy-D-manno-octulosonate 8-phosphate phosphatase (KDO 8-P phosphatase)
MPDKPTLNAADIALICYDFDGVMTDNRVLVDESGREAVMVNRGDGLAVAAFKRQGLAQIILSTETNPVVAARAAKLGIPVLQGLDDKAATLTAWAAQQGFDLARTVFIGNDINDLEVMKLVGWPVAPADAHSQVLAMARIVTNARGGYGVIREFLDIVQGT